MVDLRVVWAKEIAEPAAREIDGIDDRAIAALERPDRGHHASTRFRGRAQVLSVETERSGPLDPALPERAAILDVELGIAGIDRDLVAALRSEEHTSELQSLMRISYAVFCLKKKKHSKQIHRQ